MNPYSFVLNDSHLGPTSQGDLGALYAVLKVMADSYSSGYGSHTHGNAYRYVVANFPEGTFKSYVARIFSPELTKT